ncbi:MAG: DUF4215 domain-containing protein [Deltaproteobacteria bacterium]|nr:MAG: DUF4215 domain-containing protein [Deltaproteobacteria bacterium]
MAAVRHLRVGILGPLFLLASGCARGDETAGDTAPPWFGTGEASGTSGATGTTGTTGTTGASATTDGGGCPPGAAGCECAPGDVCDPGLSCVDGVCSMPVCGDGIVQPGEECDDGNMDETDMCRNDCTAASCGDGIVQVGEECDDGPDNQPGAACRPNCRSNVCGDGDVWEGVEACDDTNPASLADGCTADCLPAPVGAELSQEAGAFDTSWRIVSAGAYDGSDAAAEEPAIATYGPRPVSHFREMHLTSQVPVVLVRTWMGGHDFAVGDAAGHPTLVHGSAFDSPYFQPPGVAGVPETDNLACPQDTWVVGMTVHAGSLIDAVALECAPLEVSLENGAYVVHHGNATMLGKAGGPGGSAQPPLSCPDGWVVGQVRIAREIAGYTQVGIKCHRVDLVYP